MVDCSSVYRANQKNTSAMKEVNRMVEEWKSIKGYEGYYEVSNFGNVRSLERIVTRSDGINQPVSARVLKLIIGSKGYFVVRLHKDGIGETKDVHRMIAISFIPNPYNKATVNHIDGNKINNNIKNLEWATYKENMRHAHDTGLMPRSNCNKNGKRQGEKHPLAKLKEDEVRFIRNNCRKNGGKLLETDLCEKFGVSQQVVNGIINLTIWKHVI